MSAFQLSELHISAIAHLMMPREHVQDFANKLKAANIASVNYRYNENTRKSKCKLSSFDTIAELNLSMDDLVQLIYCWTYQACEGNLLDFQILEGFLMGKLDALGYEKGYLPKSTLWAI